jgi:drug/metabolite transporter (DMT)-like permease
MPAPPGRTRLRLQLVAALPLPLLVALWALWRDVFVLDSSGLERVGDGRALAAWALLSLASAALAACLFAPIRPLRVTGYTFHTLLLSIAFGVAAVLGTAHAFGGPSGDLSAPAWALAALALTALACAAAIVATAALFVLDMREAGEEGA